MESSGQQELHGRSEILLSRFSAAQQQAATGDRSVRSALNAISSWSPALTQSLSNKPEIVEWLFLERNFLEAANPADIDSQLAHAVQGTESLSDIQSLIRNCRLKEISRLATRDLMGLADLHEVMAVLSALADACLKKALAAAENLTAQKYDCSREELGFKPIILGMGKLGGRELNYSSDVDLIYLYRMEEEVQSGPPVQEKALYLFNLVTRIMSEVTKDGFVFRVDLDLRPGGKDGAMAQTLASARNHYLIMGQPWERMAMLKARPVAGDEKIGWDLLEDLEPFVFRRHLDYTSLEEIKDLKARFTRENKTRFTRTLAKGQPSVNVKLSPGGIREIEFFVQALTLTFGGRLPYLRKKTTLDGLEALVSEGMVDRSDADDLARAYVFLRTVEHRLQLREMTQTQTISRTDEVRTALAESMGYTGDPWNEFQKALKVHMAAVSRHYGELLADPGDRQQEDEGASGDELPSWVMQLMDGLEETEEGEQLLKDAGFARPDAALAVFRDVRRMRYLPHSLSRYTAHVERLLPVMIAHAAGTPDPDRAILHLGNFMTSIGPKAGFLVLLEENPKLIKLLSILFGSSDFLAGILIRHPAILDSLIDRRSTAEVKTRQMMVEELDLMLGEGADPETALAVIRRFKNDETLRIGLYDLLEQAAWKEVQTQLTDLAEVVVDRTMRLVMDMVLPDMDPEKMPLVVMSMGKLGGREMAYGSDLDLVFVLHGETELPMERAVKAAQRFISFLSLHMDAGPGYEIDSRLRPSGSHGPLVVTADSFRRYHETSLLWERQALLKIRRIWGPEELGDRVLELAEEAIFGRDLPDDAAAQIDNLRLRMSKERGRIRKGSINMKFSRGGMVDVEFLTQYLQLIHGREYGREILYPDTGSALRSLANKGLGPEGLKGLEDDYGLLGRTACRLGLVYNRSGDRASYVPEEIDRAHLPDVGDPATESITRAMERVALVYDRVFGRDGQNGA